MIKAIIFDMDGVLTDTERARFEILKTILAEKNILLGEEHFKKLVGIRTANFLKYHFGDILDDEQIIKINNKRYELFFNNPEKYMIPTQSAISCVKNLHKCGFPLGIASASDLRSIELVTKNIGVYKCFSYLVGFDSVKNTKPAPDPYLLCAEKLGVDPYKCVAIEDSPVGVKSAKSAGLYCIAVTYTHDRSLLFEADLIVDSLKDVTPDLIKKI